MEHVADWGGVGYFGENHYVFYLVDNLLISGRVYLGCSVLWSEAGTGAQSYESFGCYVV